MGKNIYDDREPVVTAWVVQDDPDPDKWTVNIQASIMDAYMLVTALSVAAMKYAADKKRDQAYVSFYLAEDIGFQLERIGGFEAAERIAKQRMEEDRG